MAAPESLGRSCGERWIGLCIGADGHPGIPAGEERAQAAVECAGPGLERPVRAPARPAHLLAFREALAHNDVDGRLDKFRRHPLAVAVTLGVVRDRIRIVRNVGVKLGRRPPQRRQARVGALELDCHVGEILKARHRPVQIAIASP